MFRVLMNIGKLFYQLTTIMPFSLALTNFRKEYKLKVNHQTTLVEFSEIK